MPAFKVWIPPIESRQCTVVTVILHEIFFHEWNAFFKKFRFSKPLVVCHDDNHRFSFPFAIKLSMMMSVRPD